MFRCWGFQSLIRKRRDTQVEEQGKQKAGPFRPGGHHEDTTGRLSKCSISQDSPETLRPEFKDCVGGKE